MNITKLKEAIQQANPEIMTAQHNECRCGVGKPFGDKCNCEEWTPRPIRLADVLMAIDKKYRYDGYVYIDMMGKFLEKEDGKILAYWNLKETLDNQSDPTKKFLTELLT